MNEVMRRLLHQCWRFLPDDRKDATVVLQRLHDARAACVVALAVSRAVIERTAEPRVCLGAACVAEYGGVDDRIRQFRQFDRDKRLRPPFDDDPVLPSERATAYFAALEKKQPGLFLHQFLWLGDVHHAAKRLARLLEGERPRHPVVLRLSPSLWYVFFSIDRCRVFQTERGAFACLQRSLSKQQTSTVSS